jgi:NAD(P)-dependent dehydrogenase (short-subunit alcohol dehydrogenase family)
MSHMGETDRPVVLITGSSGSIGNETVKCATDRGALVITADMQPLPAHISAVTDREITLDLLDDAAVGRAFSSLGPLHHVIAIAGGGDVGELGQSDPVTENLETFSRVVANNLHISFITIRHSVPFLRQTPGDRSITLVGSINAFGGYGAPGYSAAKAGLIGLVNAMAAPLGADGIRINCVALGTVDTENLHRLAHARGEELDLAPFIGRAPLRRALTPREVAVALVAAAFDMPGMTGATVILDNGQTRIR